MKTPFEIRLELLNLAKEILLAKHAARAVEHGIKGPDTSPTAEDIISEAQKLNNFVSHSGLHR